MAEEGSERTPRAQRLLDVKEACESLRTTRGTLYRLMADGRLPSVVIGRRRYIRPEALDAFVDGLDDGGSW